MPHKLYPPGKRGKFWYLRGTDTGGRFEVSTGKTTRKDAAEWADAWFLARASDRVPGAGEAVGFSTAAEHYRAFRHLSKIDARHLDRLAAYLGQTDCRILTHAHFVEAANRMHRGKSNATKNRQVIGPGAAVMHYAAGQKWCDYQRIAKFKVSRKSTREPAQDADMALLMANVEKQRTNKLGRKKDVQVAYKRLFLAMVYETGLRLSHLLSIEWRRIDLPARRIYVRITKSDELAAVPISEVVVSMLANLQVKYGRLFPWHTNTGVYGWLNPLKESLGITYTPHMSRHRLATDADAAGIPDKRAALLGMWQDPRSLHRYQHVRPDAIPGRDAGKLMKL